MFSSTPKTTRTIARKAIKFTIPKLYRGKCKYIGYHYYDDETGKFKRFRLKMKTLGRKAL